jgi:hypothetical protein
LLLEGFFDLVDMAWVINVKLLLLDFIVEVKFAHPFAKFEFKIVEVEVHNEIQIIIQNFADFKFD